MKYTKKQISELFSKGYFKWVVGYEGFYYATRCGNIVRSNTGKVIKKTITKGYERITLSMNNIQKTFTVHRLIAKAFLLNQKETVNHINGVKNDNRVDNLEWATWSENNKHAWDTKLDRVTDRSIKTSRALGKRRAKPIYGINIETGRRLDFESQAKAASYISGTQSVISKCCLTGSASYGYKWYFTSPQEDK